MEKVKGLLTATALSGLILAGAGYGTYSWFSDQETVNGSVQNAVIELDNPTGNLIKLTDKKLAPSRSAFSDYIFIDNKSTENTYLTATYESEVTGKAGVDLSYYRSATVIRIQPQEPNDDTKQKDLSAIKSYLDTGNTEEVKNLYLNTQNNVSFYILDGYNDDAVIEEIKQKVNQGNNVTVMQVEKGKPANPGKPDKPENSKEPIPVDNIGGSEPLGTTYSKTIFEDMLTHNKDIYVAYGVKLLENAGNEFQGASFEAKINFLLEQVEKKPN
ncbi:SipW-dependent-type signal peptide-containing protein [Bacillus sp. FJAT-27251]|uniref:SipW-dependent-type signal peptide-containing protein n=1 Tax=Bacillus sp. FJAT-27251 TaxID=1684142 RepID=UPI0006A7B9DA|nr:SipW-dependent-type signal peptide-containing protein [Bacillus sp. FJAT-27251]